MFWRFESAVMSCSSRPLALKKIRDFQTVGWAAAVKHQNVLLRLTTVCLAGQYFNRAVSPSSRPLLVDCVFILDFTERCSVCSVNQQQFGGHVWSFHTRKNRLEWTYVTSVIPVWNVHFSYGSGMQNNYCALRDVDGWLQACHSNYLVLFSKPEDIFISFHFWVRK